ncbi:MAG TPA: carbon starvation protein A, partial [Arthrobacter sp.]|nr:carbon starvation protein A [Arthrobacter sp.]
MSQTPTAGSAPDPDRDSDVLVQDPNLPPVALDPEIAAAEERRWPPLKIAIWVAIALLGGLAWTMLAFVRGETVNAIWFVFAAVCTYLIFYRFYS